MAGKAMTTPPAPVAYFSMEIAIDPQIPTYSGGLGILAGDTLRSAADLRIPMVAVTLAHRQGYFAQKLDPCGWQTEQASPWEPEQWCEEAASRAEVELEGRRVTVRGWRRLMRGIGGFEIPVFFLDTKLPENSDWDRRLTDFLYGGDFHYRLCQEAVLGIGGLRLLRAMGYHEISRFHMNEGHAAFLGLELLDERARWFGRASLTVDDVNAIRRRCVFTTHTPVPAGHDRFPIRHVQKVLGRSDLGLLGGCDDELNMTYLALNLSHYINGVAKKHGEVSRQLLTQKSNRQPYTIDHITNGVHLSTWAAPAFQTLFDRHIPSWREDNASFRSALNIPEDEVWSAHLKAKESLFSEIRSRGGPGLELEILTLGFARRTAAYKRPLLLLSDVSKLKRLAKSGHGLQIVYTGKAHPQDFGAKHLIQEIVNLRESLLPEVKLVYLTNYDWQLAKALVAGVDLWINTPQPPLEASGTSGMKAALNGVPSLSVLDGWWWEGWIEGVTGWAIGENCPPDMPADQRVRCDLPSLLDKLEYAVIPAFRERTGFLKIMRQAIALNASYFNTQRMLQEYVVKAYYS